MFVDIGKRVNLIALDGSRIVTSPDAEPIVSLGPAPKDGEPDYWYLSVAAIGLGSQPAAGLFPLRRFLAKEDAVGLHDMIKWGVVQWQDVPDIEIKDGKRRLLVGKA